uniref:(northern house mosquito) hypothetical protein n=1 Tax=Culex pipiens TaxID=7175 RepID=A0A8D8NEJ1_CULPI
MRELRHSGAERVAQLPECALRVRDGIAAAVCHGALDEEEPAVFDVERLLPVGAAAPNVARAVHDRPGPGQRPALVQHHHAGADPVHEDADPEQKVRQRHHQLSHQVRAAHPGAGRRAAKAEPHRPGVCLSAVAVRVQSGQHSAGQRQEPTSGEDPGHGTYQLPRVLPRQAQPADGRRE